MKFWNASVVLRRTLKGRIMADSQEIKTMRYMEWERAKGSLRAILASFWDFHSNGWDKLHDMVDEFIREFGEEAGLD
jgi:hypothetical protein